MRLVVVRLVVVLLLTAVAATAQWSNGYTYRTPVYIDAAKVAGTSNLTNFTFEISGTYAGDPDLRAVAYGGGVTSLQGWDIRFETTGGAQLDHYLLQYVPSTGQIKTFVEGDTVLYSSTTTFYMFYGKSGLGASEENKTGTWRSDYLGVWGLDEGDSTAAGFYKDATSNANNCTLSDTDGDSTSVTAQVHLGVSLTDDVDRLDCGSPALFDDIPTAGAYTAMLWLVPDTSSSLTAFGKEYSTSNGWMIYYASATTKYRFAARFSTSNGVWETSTNAQNGVWTHIAVVYDGTSTSIDPKIYINGVVESESELSTPSGTYNTDAAYQLVIGNRDSENRSWRNPVDDVRLVDGELTAGEIETIYNSTYDPGSFYSFGATETSGGPPAAQAKVSILVVQ